MAHLTLLILAIAAFQGVTSKSLTHQPAVILLDFGDNVHRHPSSSQWVYPRSLQQLPKQRAVFCTNTHFPQDTFCEVGVIIERDYPEQYITEINMTFPHPSKENTKCSVRLDLDDGSFSKARLTYRDFYCEPESDDITEVPPFKVLDVEKMTIRSRKYDNVNYICWHEFKNARLSEGDVDGTEAADTYEEPNVKFVHDGITCISSISFNPNE